MRTYTISKTELDTVSALVKETATVGDLRSLLGDDAPIQPVSVDVLKAGWVGAEWVRAVAHYQDAASVGYASLADLERDHQWTTEVAPDFAAPEAR